MHQQEAVLPVEQPQLRASVGGEVVPGAIELEVESVAYFAADRFRIGFAIGAAAFTTIAYFLGLGLETITIEARVSGGGYSTLLVGQIDNIQIDMLENKAILTGRDLAARLIDTEIYETFVNQTASQIAVTIAQRHQLTPNVTATTALTGQYYQLDHARTALGVNARVTTEWNLLSTLASAENFHLSVVGTVLNFGPSPLGVPVFLTPQNFTSLTFDMAASLPGGTVVKSWNCRDKTAISQSKGAGLMTTLVRPNLTQGQAQLLATNHLVNIAQHAVVLLGTMPGDLVMLPGMQVEFGGTNSTLDQSYTIIEVSRIIDVHHGFMQRIRAYMAS
jgi:hypothetical protein